VFPRTEGGDQVHSIQVVGAEGEMPVTPVSDHIEVPASMPSPTEHELEAIKANKRREYQDRKRARNFQQALIWQRNKKQDT
jgi:hypothetical protein